MIILKDRYIIIATYPFLILVILPSTEIIMWQIMESSHLYLKLIPSDTFLFPDSFIIIPKASFRSIFFYWTRLLFRNVHNLYKLTA